MQKNYKIVILISFFLIFLSIGSSLSYYLFSMNLMQKQLKTQSLPLSVDNIYTDIQKQILEPYLVSSMMANDTFVHSWLQNGEKDIHKIQKYLDKIKNKHSMLVTFLVSQETQNYYTQNGFIEKVQKSKPQNSWYYKFRDGQKHHEINIDFNKHINNSVIMFMNFKIFDEEYHYLGATGVGIEISHINEMLQRFRDQYKLKVTFLDKDGTIILSENYKYGDKKNIHQDPNLKQLIDKILRPNHNTLEYTADGLDYIIEKKYIQELGIYLLVEAKLDDFTTETKTNFYINLSISLTLSLIIALIIIKITREYYQKLEELADFDSLTTIPNRRNFSFKFEQLLYVAKRSKKSIALLFIDIDDFKKVNDTYGHTIGDEVLKEFANVLQSHSRESDLIARWGGEEFIIAFFDTDAQDAKKLANTLRELIKNNIKLKGLIGSDITISVGIATSQISDTIDTIISRADGAMYIAKNSGKDSVYIA